MRAAIIYPTLRYTIMSFLHKSGFYSIDRQFISDNKLTSTIQLNKSHKIFSGHFPNSPVTPGACTFQIIKELMEMHTKSPLLLTKASNIKYIDVINPEKDPNIEYQISYKIVEDTFQTIAVILQKNIIMCKFSGSFSAQN